MKPKESKVYPEPTIILVGCGFLGSIFTEEILRRAFAGEFGFSYCFIDCDAWEARNVANQNVTTNEADKEEPKAETMARRAANFWQKGRAIVKRITGENINEILGAYTEPVIIVDGVDNLETRQLLYSYGMTRKIPVLHMGITEMGTGVVEWSHPEHDTFHLAPARTVGKTIEDPKSGVLKPCELARMRSVGWNTAFAAAKAASVFLGFDPENSLPEGTSFGCMTEWDTTPTGHIPRTETWSWVGDHVTKTTSSVEPAVAV